MIYHDMTRSVDLSLVKAIHKEYIPTNGGYLVFELNDFVHLIENPERGQKELRSFPNSPIKFHFKDGDSLRAYFDEWVEMWGGFKRGEG
jgi:hypothetical protein